VEKNKPDKYNKDNKTIPEESDTYISLQEATKYCNYSQEYLSFRARQGKLKAVKFNRNWVTKKEWLEEYLSQVEGYKQKINEKKITPKVAVPPKNLPVWEIRKSTSPKLSLIERLRFVPIPLVIVLGVLLTTSIFYGQASFQNVYSDLDPYVINISQAGSLVLSVYSQIIKDSYSEVDFYVREMSGAGDIIIGEVVKATKSSFLNVGAQTASVGNSFKGYGNLMVFIWLAAFGGGLFRGLVGFIKHQFSYKNVPFRLNYFLAMMFISGIVGLVVAIATKELGFTLFGVFTPALAFVIGYAGGDFIENIYKIIIKKSNLYEK